MKSNHFKVLFFRYITWAYQYNDCHTNSSISFMNVLADIHILQSSQKKGVSKRAPTEIIKAGAILLPK